MATITGAMIHIVPCAVIKQPLPEGAVGCRSQSELIEVQEMVKTGKINLNEAQMLYNAWMHRHGRNNAASFRERKVGSPRSVAF